MDFSPRPTWADINLRALLHNLKQVRAHCAKSQGVLAVVKADAYGHGAVAIGRALEAAGVEQFGVATLEEGIELRAAGLETPILVFGGCYKGQECEFVRQRLVAAVSSLSDLRRLERFGVANGLRFPLHLKCDTGMGRIGFLPTEISQLMAFLSTSRGVEVTGLMSHLACADVPDSPATLKQIGCFREILCRLEAGGIRPAAVHLSNSAGLVAWQAPECTLVRPGIMLYGGSPTSESETELKLQPVMTFLTRITQLRTIESGQGISYGHSYHTRRPTRLATLPVGYADGYNRLLSNCGEVLVRGQRAPLVGRVCMDWILVDVTDIEDAVIGDRVVLLGSDGQQIISAKNWADKIGSIDYEVFCRISQRVPRHIC